LLGASQRDNARTRAALARVKDKGVVLGNRANLAAAAPKGPPLCAMLNT
jgi:hypothetical protein